MQRPSQLSNPRNANGQQSDSRKLVEDFHHYKGIIFRGWRYLVICVLASLAAAVIFLAASKPTYKAASRLLVIQQSGHPVHVTRENDPFSGGSQSDDNLATHLLLLKSPVIIEQALKVGGLNTALVGSVIGGLTVKQPDPAAKIIDLTYKSKSTDEAYRVLASLIESYKLFLKTNYQKNSSDVIGLIVKARDELNTELKSLEQAYLEYRQKNPNYSADSTGHTFVARRLDQWDQALNQFAARSLQLQSQLELGKKMARQGVDPATIANTLGQAGAMGATTQTGQTGSAAAAAGPATNSAANDGSYVGIARDLADVEARRKTAELYLEHFQSEHQSSSSTREIGDREIERMFLHDPDVIGLKQKYAEVYSQLAAAKRAARSATDPGVLHHIRGIEDLEKQYQRLWEAKRPEIAESLRTESNPEVGGAYRAAQAEVITLKAREKRCGAARAGRRGGTREAPAPARETSSRAWGFASSGGPAQRKNHRHRRPPAANHRSIGRRQRKRTHRPTDSEPRGHRVDA